jgi:hypothetical protein
MLLWPDSKINKHNPYTSVPVGIMNLTRGPQGTQQAVVGVLSA